MHKFGNGGEGPQAREIKPWLCPEDDGGCGKDRVFPVDWREVGSTHWWVHLRCPECEWLGEVALTQDEAERFDERLDRGTVELLRDLRQMTHTNMSEEIDFFVRALNADIVMPSDFEIPTEQRQS
jgi:hypothetical protein